MDHLRYPNPSVSYQGLVVPGSGRYTNPKNVPVPVGPMYIKNNNGPVALPVPNVMPMQTWNGIRPYNYMGQTRNSVSDVRYGSVKHHQHGGNSSNFNVNQHSKSKNKMPVTTPSVTIMKDSQSQTDFPKEIADLHLKELPNSLYQSRKSTKNFHSSNNENTGTTSADEGTKYHADKNSYDPQERLHKNNVISSGTHPLSQQNKEHVKENTGMSYSMMAQKPPISIPKTDSRDKTLDVDEPQTGEITGTKKKRKRNRKKKKQNDPDGQDDTSDIKNLEADVAEMNIHLEDEFEFPDLLGKKKPSVRQPLDSSMSQAPQSLTENMHGLYSTTSEQETVQDSENVNFGSNDQLSFKQASETKSARKRRKRRDQANKAANEEMAEITIEQQMLQELGLKSKLEQSTTKEPTTPAPNKQKGKNNRKSNQPIALDFAAMIDALEQRRDDAITTKNAPRKPGIRKKPKPDLEPPRKPHNPLDSTCPKVKRGKEREFPKPKKPSPLKKVILKEREEKKRLRLLDEDPSVGTGDSQVCVGVVNTESDLSQEGEERTKGSVSAELSPISQTSPFSMSPLSPSASPLHSGFNSPIAKDSSNPALLKIHSRRYREYCTQILDKDIDNCCLHFLQNLVRYQDKQYHKDPRKAKARRRIVLGLREVTKHLKLNKIKCVIISPNLEKIQSKGGLDDALNNILNMCTEQEVPYVFALGRRALGRACAKLVPVSVVGVFNYEGSEKHFWRLIELTQKATDSYKEMVSVVEKDIQENPNNRVGPSNVPNLFAHMGHSRTPSGCSAISFTSSILSEPISENYPYSEPETDSKGFEVSKHGRSGLKGIQSSVINEQSVVIDELDAGNEADTEDFTEATESSKQFQYTNSLDKDDLEDPEDDPDNIEDLPHIDSIHYSNYELNVVEILSQHSSRTIENSEAMSTHSSKTLRDGSPTLFLEKYQERHSLVGSITTPHKIIDKDRIQSWVETTQSCTDDPQVDGSALSADDIVSKTNDGESDACDVTSTEKDDAC